MFLAVLFIVPKLEIKCQSTGEWINKLVVYSWHVILPGNEKEQTSNTQNNVDEY